MASRDGAARRVDALGTRAGGEAVLQRRLVGPAVDEVAVEAVASGVAHGVDEVLVVGVRGGVVEELVEDGEDGDGVGGRADATVVVADSRVGHLVARLSVVPETACLALFGELTWLLWSALSRFSPSQQEGRYTWDRSRRQASVGSPL